MATFRIQPHVRLQEWVAEENGFFREEGLDYEFEPQGYAGASWTTASVQPADAAPLSARSGALEDMEKGRSCSVSGACHWAVNAAASTMHGKMWGKAYSVCVSGIFVAPDSPYHRPEDLADVKVGVGYHSGSHYSAIQALEPFLERSEIALDFVGLPFDRVRLMQQGRIEAANVFGAQFYLLEQLGFRKLVDTTFIMGALVSETPTARTPSATSTRCVVPSARSTSRRSATSITGCASSPTIWRGIDVRRFGPGERIVFEPYTREMYERTHRWMERWELFDSILAAAAHLRYAVLT